MEWEKGEAKRSCHLAEGQMSTFFEFNIHLKYSKLLLHKLIHKIKNRKISV